LREIEQVGDSQAKVPQTRDLGARVKEAFEHTSPTNPLRTLGELDKRLLCSLLTIYIFESQRKGRASPQVKLLEEAAKTATEAAALAKRMQRHVFTGNFGERLKPFLHGLEDLPLRLLAFSGRVGSIMDVVGKPGHKEHTLQNRVLVQASELVKLRTGSPNDEHLAELCQAMTLDEELKKFCESKKRVRGRPGVKDELSGDAIRKKREHLAKVYPVLYRHAVKEMKSTIRRAEHAAFTEGLSSA
jgi:hypothetical protein